MVKFLVNKYLCLSFLILTLIMFFLSKIHFFGVLLGFLGASIAQEYKKNITEITLDQVFSFFCLASLLTMVGGDFFPSVIIAPMFVIFLGGLFFSMLILWWRS